MFWGAGPFIKDTEYNMRSPYLYQKQYLQLKWEIPKVQTFRNKGI